MGRSRSRSRSRERDRRHQHHNSHSDESRPRHSNGHGYKNRTETHGRDSNLSDRIPFTVVKKDESAGRANGGSSSSGAQGKAVPVEEKQKPNFGTSGKLMEDTNMFKGRVIKYNEPPEAMKPKRRWRFYPFKGDEQLPVMYIHRQSAYLIGKDRVVADFPVDHPSCSGQHAVLQYRLVPITKPDGENVRVVRPYIIDLGSTNGTFLNSERVEPRRYYELKEKDVLKFGFSTREYVILHDKTDTGEVAGDDEGIGTSPQEDASN